MTLTHCIINGNEPRIAGQTCTGLMLLHFVDGLSISDQVNVAHLRFDAQWHQLYFECGTVFWRTSPEPPGVPTNSRLEYGLVLNDLSEMESVVGCQLESIRYEGHETGDVEAWLRFASGRTLAFRYSAATDSTRVAAWPAD